MTIDQLTGVGVSVGSATRLNKQVALYWSSWSIPPTDDLDLSTLLPYRVPGRPPVDLYIGITLEKLLHVNEAAFNFEAEFSFNVQWHDSRINSNCDQVPSNHTIFPTL
jgi:hypothetical protein